MRYLRLLLLPFSLLYGLVMAMRNWLYDTGFFKSKEFDFPVISVGNLEVGGAGKSPMTEYLIRLLKEDFVGAMTALSALRASGDAFFDKVTVNADDAKLRVNRLRLLSQIRVTMNQVADFSQIEG